MHSTYQRTAILVAVLGALLAGCATNAQKGSAPQSTNKPSAKRNVAPDFNLKDIDGKPIKLSDYKGKVVLLNFWATWCGPCRIEIPWFIEFQKTYKDRGFTVIGVALDDEGWDVVKPYVQEKQINYPVAVGDAITEQAFGPIESLPTTLIIDKEGRIANAHVGLIGKRDYASDIEHLLQ
jgi:thiol-disulfide isomerase/thioredoxin